MLTDNALATPSHPVTNPAMPPPNVPPDSERDSAPEIGRGGTSHQGELFETQPPPWELAVEDDVAIASVVFSEAPHGPYDYRIPDKLRGDLQPGMRVLVPLGRRRRPIGGWCIETKLGSSTHRTLARSRRSLRRCAAVRSTAGPAGDVDEPLLSSRRPDKSLTP